MNESANDFPDLPPYTYVPGHAPHPVSDPKGHMRHTRLPETWSQHQHLLWGKRLFENGFYWEAHEAWEHVWLDLGRTSGEALTTKGLIKLAASGVKCREGNVAGAIRHALRAAELLCPGSDSKLFDCCDLKIACESAKRISQSPPVTYATPSSQPVPLPNMQV